MSDQLALEVAEYAVRRTRWRVCTRWVVLERRHGRPGQNGAGWRRVELCWTRWGAVRSASRRDAEGRYPLELLGPPWLAI